MRVDQDATQGRSQYRMVQGIDLREVDAAEVDQIGCHIARCFIHVRLPPNGTSEKVILLPYGACASISRYGFAWPGPGRSGSTIRIECDDEAGGTVMMQVLRRVGRDIRARRHIEVYVIVAASVVVAVLSLVGEVVSEGARWSVVLSAVGLLLYQVTLPDGAGSADDVLRDRTAFDATTFESRLARATEVWVYGPSAVNLLTAHTAEVLRTRVLDRPDGRLRVVVLDNDQEHAVAIAHRQLDEAPGFQTSDLPHALEVTVDRLERMARWGLDGRFEYRLAPYNPGFSMVALDPGRKDGVLIIEFHAVHNQSTGQRMHVELTRRESERWYEYWKAQFEYLWDQSRVPVTTHD